MTKETKIGLLVGLAFIILFAIILSEKGPINKGASAPVFTTADSSKVGPAPSRPPQPLREVGKLPVDSLGPIVTTGVKPLPAAPMKEEPIAQASADDDSMDHLPDSLASLIKKQPDKFEVAKSTPNSAAPQVPLTAETKDRSAEPIQLAAAQPRPMDANPREHDRTVKDAGEDDKKSSSEIENAAKNSAPVIESKIEKTSPPLPIKTEHTVAPGENLGKIAAKYYGRSTPARVEAVFNANRDTLTSVSAVRAGDKLKIPDLGEHSDQFEPAPNFVVGQMASVPSGKIPRDGQVRIPMPLGDQDKPADDSHGNSDRDSHERRVAAKPNKPEKKTVTVASKTGQPREAKYDVYEVRKGDTLCKIARRELGSEKFARELTKLNKDKLNDKNTLRPGTKILLPSKAVMGGETAAMLSSRGLENAEP